LLPERLHGLAVTVINPSAKAPDRHPLRQRQPKHKWLKAADQHKQAGKQSAQRNPGPCHTRRFHQRTSSSL
jgi:hypothetical protein